MKPEQYMPAHLWAKSLSLLPHEEQYKNRIICKRLKEVSDALRETQKNLWMKLDGSEKNCDNCSRRGHFVTNKDAIVFKAAPTADELRTLASLFPNIKVLKVDVIREYGPDAPGDQRFVRLRLKDIFPSLVCMTISVHYKEERKNVNILHEVIRGVRHYYH